MSVQEPPQFTPAQVLEAGQRAESEGRLEFAIQFYRHLVDQYPGSSEAAAAQSGLSRLAGGPPPAPAGRRGGNNPPPLLPQVSLPAIPPFEPQRLEPLAAPPALANPFDAARQGDAPYPYQSGYFGAPAPALAGQAQTAPPVMAEPAIDVELPPEPRDYRTGRFLARLFAWLGGLAVLAGIAVMVLAVLRPRAIPAIPFLGMPLPGAATGAILILAGLFQVMIGQLVRAVLDHANAARDSAGIARAEAEARYGGSPRRSRRR